MRVATYVCPHVYWMVSTSWSILEKGDEEEEK
jgi:hypothetical protein